MAQSIDLTFLGPCLTRLHQYYFVLLPKVLAVFEIEVQMAGMQIHESLLVIPPPPPTILKRESQGKVVEYNKVPNNALQFHHKGIFSAIQYDIHWPNYSVLHKGNDTLCL